jgi:alkaline phosphatase
MATGLVATSSITHATPAGFGAHTVSRKEETTIAEHLIANRINVLLGGGHAFFAPQSITGSRRKDNIDLVAEAKNAGYEYAVTLQEMQQASGKFLLGLFAGEGMTTQRPEPTLEEMTLKALQVLGSNNKGFILMVEGSQIDWANHENNEDESARQTILFDQAVQVVLEYAVKDGHTLVVVVADHETGGIAINSGTIDGQKLSIAWTTKGHTGATVPLYAYGPGAWRLSGFHENTDIPKTFAELLGIRPFPLLHPTIN